MPKSASWYEDTIRSHPGTHFGVWTPEGWKTHKKILGETISHERGLQGDGVKTKFRALPSGVAEGVHDESDLATDGAIYPAEVRIEYPLGRPRWAVSHTYLAYPHADQTLYSQEYTVDYETGNVRAYFRCHVVLEEGITDERDGLTVCVKNRPISTVLVGNKSYPLCNSAVRGVWTDAEKTGENLYVREQVRLCRSLNAIYIPVREAPVIQCHGIWKAEERDVPAFDEAGGCVRPDVLMENRIPLDCPRLGAVGYTLRMAPSTFYEADVELMDSPEVRVSADWLPMLRRCQGRRFKEHETGYAAWGSWDHNKHIFGHPDSYAMLWDFNENGEVDAEDEKLLEQNVGRMVRTNYYTAAYFGNDWLSTGVLLEPEMHVDASVVCAWQQGAGYEPGGGVIRLFNSPGPGQRVFVEYHYDAPAESGNNAIYVRYRTAPGEPLL
jgi:hypothetical protein